MDYQKFTQPGTAGSMDAIRFDEKIYWVSALVDVLRDNAKDLLELTNNGRTPNMRLATNLAERYGRLREEACSLFGEDDAAKLKNWTRELGTDVTDDEIYEASANLARCLDVVIQLPAFVATRVSQRSEIRSVFTKAVENGDIELTATASPAQRPAGPGHYL